jgi:hypothetical protein
MLDQLHYPILNSIEAEPGDSFYDTQSIMIETPSLDLSIDIAKELMEEAHIKEWGQKTEGPIYAAEIHSADKILSGYTNDIIRVNE